MRATNLKTEYIKNPLGIDVSHPRLFWNCEDGLKQTAYRVVAESDGTVVWDSGKVDSDRMAGIVYPHALVSRQRVNWKVMLWDENDRAGDWSDDAFFEMGLLDAEDWQAGWITGNYKVNRKERYPVD